MLMQHEVEFDDIPKLYMSTNILPKKSQAIPSGTSVKARLAGRRLNNLVVLKNNNSLNDGVTLCSQPRQRPSSKLPLWRNASEMAQRVGYMNALASLRDYKTVAFTLNLSPSTEKAIRKQGHLNYPRDEIRKVLTKQLPDDSPILYFFVAEESERGRLHLHGAFAVPTTPNMESCIANIDDALAQKLGRRYRQRYTNKRTDLKTEYRRTAHCADEQDNLTRYTKVTDINCGWMHYCSKDIGNLVRQGVLDREIVASKDLRQLSKSVWNIMRNLARGFDAGVKVLKSAAESIRQALSAKQAPATTRGERASAIPLEHATPKAPPSSQKKSIFSEFCRRQCLALCTLLLFAYLSFYRLRLNRQNDEISTLNLFAHVVREARIASYNGLH